MARETESIMRGKRSVVVMSEAVRFGKRPARDGTMMSMVPKKLRTRLLRASMPEAESQITGKTARTARPGSRGAAPFRSSPMARKSRTGISRYGRCARRSQGTRRQPRNRTPWRRMPER
jgi:hypothetical protein